jgi:outer membrane protein insertion porin family
MDAEMVVAGGDLRIQARRIETEAGTVEGEGTIETISPFVARFDMSFRLDAAPLTRALLPDLRERFAGDLDGSFRLELAKDSLGFEGDTDTTALTIDGIGPFDGNAHWNLRNDLVKLEGLFHRGSSRYDLDGVLDLERREQTLSVRLDSPSLEALLQEWKGPEPPWDASLQARVSAHLSEFSLDTVAGSGAVWLKGDLQGRVDLDLQGRDIAFDARDLGFPGGRGEAWGRLQRLDMLTANYRLDMSDLTTTLLPFVGDVSSSFGGELRVEGSSVGPLREASDIESSLVLDSGDFHVSGGSYLLYSRVDQRGSHLDFDRLSLVTGSGLTDTAGELTFAGVVDFETRTMDVRGTVASFPVHEVMPLDGISTFATGSFESTGAFEEPVGTAALELAPLTVSSRALPPLHLEAGSSGGMVSIDASRSDDGRRLATARADLRKELLSADVDLSSLPWMEMASSLAPGVIDRTEASSIGVAGKAHLELPLREPSLFEAEASVEAASFSIRDRTIETTPFSLGIDRQSLRVDGLKLLYGEESVAIDGVVSLGESQNTHLDLLGNVPLEIAEGWFPEKLVGGLLHLDLELSRSLDDPQLVGEITVAGGSVADRLVARESLPALENLVMQARASGSRIEVTSLRADLLGGELVASGAVPVPGKAPGRTERLAFDVSGIDAIRLARRGRETEHLTTSVSLRGELMFPEGGFDGWESEGDIQEVLIAGESGIIHLVEPASWSYDDFGLQVGDIHLEGDRTDLQVHVTPPAPGDAGLLASVRGRTDLHVANAALPESIHISGAALVDVDVRQIEDAWRFSGEVTVGEGEVALTDPEIAVTQVAGDLHLDGDVLRVRKLNGRAGGGTVSVEGAMRLPGIGGEPGADLPSELRLGVVADGVGLEIPEGLRSSVDARISFESRDGEGQERYRLSGEVTVVQALFDRTISPEREILKRLQRETLKLEGDPGFAGRIDLELSVTTERAVIVDNNLGEMRWDASLLVRGTFAAPEASGTLSAAPGGRLFFLANTYEIRDARIVLRSYPLEPPELDIRADTEVGGREIVLSVTGRTDNLRTLLESPTDPELGRGDVASLLLTGRTLEEVSGREADVIGQEAASYLGASLAELTQTGLASALPIQPVRLEPEIVGSETDPGARFSIGRAITEDLFLIYSIGLDDPEKQLWIIDLNLPRRLKLRAIREDENDYIGGLSQEALFDFYERDRPKRPDELPKPRIAAVEIQGEVPLPPEEVQETLEFGVGDDYDYWTARGAAEELRDRLKARGHLAAQVEPSTEPSDPAPEEPVTLTFRVDAGPEIEFEWSGDPPPSDLRSWVRERFRAYVPPVAQVLEIGRELEWELMSRGYYAAKVKAGTDELEGLLRARLDLALGPKGNGVEIGIEGNQALSDENIRRLLPSPTKAEFFKLLLGKTQELREEVGLLYAGEGYLETRVEELQSELDPESGKLRVTLRIEEGEVFRIGEIRFQGAESFSEDALRAELSLEPGTVFRFLTHLRDRQRLSSFYRAEGFPDVQVRSSLARIEGRVDVTFFIEEGTRIRVGSIRITGTRVTREKRIRAALTFGPGDPLRLSDLTETQRRLYNLRVFRSVDVRPVPSETEGVRDVAIELTELPDLRLAYGGRYSTEEQLEFTGNAELTNVLGTARQLTLHVFANRRITELRATFDVPSFFGIDVGSSFFVSRETEEGEGFVSSAWSATYQQGRRLFSDVLAQWSVAHRQSSVRETIPSGPFGFDIEADRTLLTFSLIHDTRSSLTRPSSGRFWNATLQFAPDLFGSDLRFIKLYGQLFLYRSIGRDVVWASTYRAGIAQGFENQLLLPTDRFRAGGPTSVRGYPVNELGPPDPVTGTIIGGEGVVILNQELRVPLFWRVGGLAFWDAGNVFLESSDFNPVDLRHTSGLGFSVDMPVGLVTVDWAVLLNPPPGFDRTRWVFTYGYSF